MRPGDAGTSSPRRTEPSAKPASGRTKPLQGRGQRALRPPLQDLDPWFRRASPNGGLVDKIPMGMAMNKGLTFRMGQTHVNRWTDDLLKRIEDGQIDPSFVINAHGRARARARDTQGVPRQAGQLRQSRPEALTRRGEP
jgi:hypothetical protein